MNIESSSFSESLKSGQIEKFCYGFMKTLIKNLFTRIAKTIPGKKRR